jgi:DNA/RNA endonuclease YhcR with UshA esterase domain
MFGHQERVAILLLIAVTLVVIAAHIVLVQIGKAPFASAYSDQSADGALVTITGIIDQATVLKNGGHVLLTVNNVTVFVPATVACDRAFAKGTAVSLYGTVQTYQGKKEILISSADDIREIQ